MADTETTVTPKVEETKTTTTVTKEVKSGNNGMKIILIVVVLLLCLCILCGTAAYFIFRGTADASKNIFDTFTNDLQKEFNNQMSNNTSDNSNDTTSDSQDEYNFSDETGDYTFGGSLSADFPTDVPIPSSAVVGFSGSSTDSNGKLVVSATMTSPDSVSQLANFYRNGLTSQGWSITGEQSFFGTSVTAEKSGREVTVVLLGNEGESTSITIAVSEL